MDWTTLILGVIIGALVSIPIGFFINMTTPTMQSWYNRSAFSSRQKRINALIVDYRYYKLLRSSWNILTIHLLRYIVTAFIYLAILVLIVGISLLQFAYHGNISKGNYIAGLAGVVIAYIICFSMLDRASTEIRNTLSLTSYKEEVVKKLKKLGGNPEDLDKEEDLSE